jgi:16S rRNA (guanine527-N7)-methyltransferase
MSDRERVLEQRSVSRETRQRLDIFVGLLQRWGSKINLVSRPDLDAPWHRHVADSIQFFDVAPPFARTWVDLGSGGGFPGLIVAILAADERPDLSVTLIDSDQRKCAFLRQAATETGVRVNVLADRIEHVPPCAADVVSARALAPLPALLGLVERHLAAGGKALLAKGAAHEGELAAALENWRFSFQKHTSVTDPESVILVIGDLARA